MADWPASVTVREVARAADHTNQLSRWRRAFPLRGASRAAVGACKASVGADWETPAGTARHGMNRDRAGWPQLHPGRPLEALRLVSSQPAGQRGVEPIQLRGCDVARYPRHPRSECMISNQSILQIRAATQECYETNREEHMRWQSLSKLGPQPIPRTAVAVTN